MSEVEKESFIELIGSLIGPLQIRGRTFFTEKLKDAYTNVRTNLMLALERALFVTTTADLWTANKRSYLGMTVHWIGDDLVRRSAVLAIRRVTDSHTYDVVAKAMYSIHKEFNIVSKVTCTITDNGSNFVKSFRLFEAGSD